MYYLKQNRTLIKTGIAACLAFFGFAYSLSARGEQGGEQIFAVANVETVLSRCGHIYQVKDSFSQQREAEQYRWKQIEVARLEQELARQRFWFFPRKRDEERLSAMRRELEAEAAARTKRNREQEKAVMSRFDADLRKATARVGERRNVGVVLDANSPHILFLKDSAEADAEDITEEVVKELNSFEFSDNR